MRPSACASGLPLTRHAALALARRPKHSRDMPQPAWVKGRLAPEPYLSRLFYGLIIKRSSTYMTAVMIVATTVGTRSLPMLTPGLRASRKRCAPLPFLLFSPRAHKLCFSRWAVPPRRHRVRLYDERRVEHDQQGGTPRATTARELPVERCVRRWAHTFGACVCLRRAEIVEGHQGQLRRGRVSRSGRHIFPK